MKLQYEIATTGQDQIRRVLRGVEQETAASDRRLNQQRTTNARRGAKAQASVMFGPGQREYIAAERARHRQALANTKSEERAKIQAERNLQRAREQLDRQRSRALYQQHKSEERSRRQLGEKISGGLATSGRRAVGTVARVGGAALGIAGGFAVAEALREQASIQRGASLLANQAGRPELKGELAKESTGVKGFTGSETLGALSGFVGITGNLEAGRGALKSMGELALATGTDFQELMEAAGNAFIPLSDKIKDPKEQLKALNDVMAAIAAQGNLGAVEIKDLASEMAGLAAATNKFTGDPSSLLKTVGAMAQAARQRGGAASADEAVTSVSRFVDDIAKDPKKFERGGIKIGKRDKQGNLTQLDDPQEIMVRMLEKTGGDLGKVSDLFGVYAGRAVAGFSPLYTQAANATKGTAAEKRAAGTKAVRAEFSRLTGAQKSPEEMRRAANSTLENSDMQFKEAMKAFNTAVGTELLPAVTKMIPAFTQLVPTLGQVAGEGAKLVSWFAENPFKGVGAIIATSVAKDVASAGISTVLSSATTSYVASLAAGELAMMKFAGAAGVAAVAIYAAYDQNESLKKESGGLGMADLAWGSLTQGTTDARGNWHGKSFFSQIDDKMNADAKAEARSDVCCSRRALVRVTR